MGRGGGRSATALAGPPGGHRLAEIGVSSMTLAAACGWSLARSLAVAVAAWPVCSWQSAWLKGMEGRTRRMAWFVIVLPFLCPELWTGYAWSGFALRVAGAEFWNLFPTGLFPSPQAIVMRDAAVDELL